MKDRSDIAANIYEQLYPVSRERLVAKLGEPTIRFLEIIQDVPLPNSETDEQKIAWKGMGNIAVKAFQATPEVLSDSEDPLASLSDEEFIITDLFIRQAKTLSETAQTLRIPRAEVVASQREIYSKLEVSSKEECSKKVPTGYSDYDGQAAQTLTSLNVAEAEVLGHLMLVENSELLPQALGISQRAAEARTSRIYSKLGVRRDRSKALRVGSVLTDVAKDHVLELVGPNLEQQVKTAINLSKLSPREITLLFSAAQDIPREQIIKEGFSEASLYSGWSNIRSKLGVTTQEAIAIIYKPKQPELNLYRLNFEQLQTMAELGNKAGLSIKEITQKSRISERLFFQHLDEIKKLLDIQTSPILRLTAEANIETIQSMKNFDYKKHDITWEEFKLISLATQDTPHSKILKIFQVSTLSIKQQLQSTLDKLGAKDVFEAFLILEPPTYQMVADLDLEILSPLEKKIFLRMKDNPTTKEMKAEFGSTSINTSIKNMGSKLNTQHRLQLARLSYAYHQKEELLAKDMERERSKQAEEARQYMEKYELAISTLVKNIMEGQNINDNSSQITYYIPDNIISTLRVAGLAEDTGLTQNDKASVDGVVMAILLSSEVGELLYNSPNLKQAAIDLVKKRVANYEKFQSQ
jgi:DNA-binding CsgD family transcriptional regulator